ncbi:6200_t:CDS:2 [Diversispora eburnea]|uniref:6200_t:CDS:1 n=1 Tax=Diversispora eburnea TaxID=1213867 RepID=A0A9N9CGJ2_9GLOM|nr:6200_t:CDS:2 [Diversispora eburnea]
MNIQTTFSTITFNDTTNNSLNHNLNLLNNRSMSESTNSLLDDTLQLGVRQSDFGNDFGSDSDDFSLMRSNFAIKHKYRRPTSAKQMLHSVVYQRLDADNLFDKNQTTNWACEIAREIKQRLIDLSLKQYKYIVNVTIMENKPTGTETRMNQILLKVEMFRYLVA